MGEPSTYISLERNGNGNVIKITRPRTGELSNLEILDELKELDHVIAEGMRRVSEVDTSQAVEEDATGLRTDKTPTKELDGTRPKKKATKKKASRRVEEVDEDDDEVEEEQTPRRSKKTSKKKVTKKKTTKKKAGKKSEGITTELVREINEAVNNIAINSLCNDPDEGPEGYDAMSEEDFDARQEEYLNEALQGEALKELSLKRAKTFLKALQNSPDYNGDFYRDGEWVEADESEDDDEDYDVDEE